MKVKRVIAVASGKGGVGKSTITYTLAKALNKLGQKVGVLDADIYGPSQHLLMKVDAEAMMESQDNKFFLPLEKDGIKLASAALVLSPSEREKALAWRAPLAVKLIRQLLEYVKWGNIDTLIIDLPPGTGDIPLTLIQHSGITEAIIVTTPSELANKIALKSLKLFQQLNIPVRGLVENMSYVNCSNCNTKNDIFQSSHTVNTIAKVPFFEINSIPDEVMDLAKDILT